LGVDHSAAKHVAKPLSDLRVWVNFDKCCCYWLDPSMPRNTTNANSSLCRLPSIVSTSLCKAVSTVLPLR